MYGCDSKPEEKTDGFDKLKNEGYVAFITNEKEVEAELPKPDRDITKCACKGTGYIWHGDGHQTKCPYHEEPEEERGDTE